MSVDGLVSGMDTTSLISQLLKAEAAPQTQLKTRLARAETQASAYRTVNSAFAALRTAAEALTPQSLTAARKATPTDTSVTATATTAAKTGSSVTFTVRNTASTQTLVTGASWTSDTAPVRDQAAPGWPIEVRNAATGAVVGTVDVAAGATLADAAAAINAAKLGITASVMKTADKEYRLQVTSQTSGNAGAVVLASSGDDPAFPGSSFLETAPGQDAVLDLGGGVLARSATNTFTDLLAGVSLTVSEGVDTPVTVSVTDDTGSMTTKVRSLVDAANAALSQVSTYTYNKPGSTAALKGEFRLTSLTGEVLTAVSSAVGADGSPAAIGLEITRDGTITFDESVFAAAVAATPELAQRMVAGRAAGPGPDGVTGNADDVTAVTGVANRLLDIAKRASDSATGSLVALAEGRDSAAKDIQSRIEAWDLRLARRKEMLTRQFAAMETALSGLKNQSSWLAGQINSLPSYS